MDPTEYTANKWTKRQKRRGNAGIADAIDLYADQRVTPVAHLQDPQKLRTVQSTLAVMAVEDRPEIAAEWLSEALGALGLDYRIDVPRVEVKPEACGDHYGTLRGYNTHLRLYTKLCEPCEAFRQEHLAAEMARRGVPGGTIVKWPS
jgi:hypothetical protein